MSILIAIKGSSTDPAALHLGAVIALRGSQQAVILTVAKHEADRQAAEATLAFACEILAQQHVEARTRLRYGHAATEIVREAEEGGYDLAIVGAGQERNPVKRLLHGSTMVRVVEHAPCPVIVTKGDVGTMQRLLLCDSGANSALAAANTGPAVPSLLNRFAALPPHLLAQETEIVILHVMSQIGAGPGVLGGQLRSNAEELIRERAPEGELLEVDIQALQRLGIQARAKVRHGLVVDEILAEARSGNYDLVVIGAYRGDGWQRILLDDQAHSIIVQMDRPVLVLR